MATRASRISMAAVLPLAFFSAASAQVTQRVDVGPGGAQAGGFSMAPSMSADGRFVAFESTATDLVPGDTNGKMDVFVRDRALGTTERVSVDSAGVEGNGDSAHPSISADGRYVAFSSVASNLVAGDTNGNTDVFLRDRVAGTTVRLSVKPSGAQAFGASRYPSISADGRYVAFESSSHDIVAGDTNGQFDIFVRDVVAGTNERVSVDSSGNEANDGSFAAAISGDGRFVAWESDATNLVAVDTNPGIDIFVHDRQTGTTELASLYANGAQADAWCEAPAISGDGRFVTFYTVDPLDPADTNALYDVFVRDRQLATTQLVSCNSAGVAGDGNSMGASAISADGRYVVFSSLAMNLGPAAPYNPWFDVFLRDRVLGTTEQIDVASAGTPGNDDAEGVLGVSSDGRYVAFASLASNLVPSDTNAAQDIYVRDRFGGPNFASLCFPGYDGTIACPCNNDPTFVGSGCANTATPAGALLAAFGSTSLASDTLTFVASDEKPTALSVLLQGTSVNAVGIVYGQGVRCVTGTLKRLFSRNASGGVVTLPNFGAGDSSVSARSAAKGDLISAGQLRYYLVFYRDPIVIGGCPPASTFNATQTGEILWAP